jgi:hypothetical protein
VAAFSAGRLRSHDFEEGVGRSSSVAPPASRVASARPSPEYCCAGRHGCHHHGIQP